MQKAQSGVLLLNLGSPKSPDPSDVRRYLKQFLNDPYVIDIPTFFRKILVDGIILNTRPKKSAEAYAQIWTKAGSPLVLHTEALVEKVRNRIQSDQPQVSVKMAMRYGSPSIDEALSEFKKEGVEELVFLPLYPQYSYAASESSIAEFERLKEKILPHVKARVIEDFFSDGAFVAALAATLKPVLDEVNPDLLMFSYHGVPERQLTKVRATPAQCGTPGCCDQWTEKNLKCYRAQSFETSRRLCQELNWSSEKMMTTFQSRLGRTKWIEPYTDIVLKDLPAKGIKNIVVASPSFTADCLETLEEIQIRYQELFLESGGEKFTYVPCLNSRDDFAACVTDLVSQKA
jgi:ferrochelatase